MSINKTHPKVQFSYIVCEKLSKKDNAKIGRLAKQINSIRETPKSEKPHKEVDYA